MVEEYIIEQYYEGRIRLRYKQGWKQGDKTVYAKHTGAVGRYGTSYHPLVLYLHPKAGVQHTGISLLPQSMPPPVHKTNVLVCTGAIIDVEKMTPMGSCASSIHTICYTGDCCDWVWLVTAAAIGAVVAVAAAF